MKKIILIIFAVLTGISIAFARETKAKENLPQYFIEGIQGTAAQGTYNVKITIVSKKANDVTDDMLARCAVHGVLFKGFGNVQSRTQQKPLAGSAAAEASHADFFESFFKPGGTAVNYAQTVQSSRTTVKSGKEYKVSSIVTVNKEQLRKDLESADIIRGLNSIF